MEYLGSAALLLENHHKAWPGCCKRWRALMLERPGGRHQALQELRASGRQYARNQDGKPVVGDAYPLGAAAARAGAQRQVAAGDGAQHELLAQAGQSAASL